MPDKSLEHVPTIAVVAVHGVGNAQQLETARVIGDLLQDLNVRDATDPAYYPFREQMLRVTVRPVIVKDDGENILPPTSMRAPLAAQVDQIVAGQAGAQDSDSLSHRFMRDQLRYYRGEEPQDTYETIRLEGSRAPQNGDGARHVHVYEMHWTDLCRLQNRLLSIFGELYQLMFHFSVLGSQTVESAAAAYPHSQAWLRLRWWQVRASLTLTTLIPALNLFMLAAVGVLLALAGFGMIGPRYSLLAVVAVLGAAAAFLGGRVLWKSTTAPFLVWVAPAIAWLAIVSATAWLAWDWVPDGKELALRIFESVVAVAASAAPIYVIANAYDGRRPGFLKLVGVLGVLLVIAPLSLIAIPSRGDPVSGLFLREFEIMFGMLFLSWCAFYGSSAVVFFAGIRAVREVKAGTIARILAKRSRWTGRIMLALPASILLAVTAVLWNLIAQAAKNMASDVEYSSVLSFLPKWTAHTLGDVTDTVLAAPFERTVPIIVLVLLASVVPGIWGLAPSTFSELFPPKAKADPHGVTSARLGKWLTRAFGGLKISGTLIYACMTLVVPLFSVATLVLGDFGTSNMLKVGLFGGTAAAFLILAPREVEKIALGFRTVLDVALDVDTWLREFPRVASPKARICGRYVSLLRYICNWRHPETGARYDAIVIVAHSQGTVISADLLRFLQRESQGNMASYDPELMRLTPPEHGESDRIPVCLFTLGCPLRQLYSLRFPYLYSWVRGSTDGSMLGPEAAKLGVDFWLNGYRSGDYIGRYLWKNDTDPNLYRPEQPRHIDFARRQSEFCLGAGAHTHYWDNTGTASAWALDALINRPLASPVAKVAGAV